MTTRDGYLGVAHCLMLEVGCEMRSELGPMSFSLNAWMLCWVRFEGERLDASWLIAVVISCPICSFMWKMSFVCVCDARRMDVFSENL